MLSIFPPPCKAEDVSPLSARAGHDRGSHASREGQGRRGVYRPFCFFLAGHMRPGGLGRLAPASQTSAWNGSGTAPAVPFRRTHAFSQVAGGLAPCRFHTVRLTSSGNADRKMSTAAPVRCVPRYPAGTSGIAHPLWHTPDGGSGSHPDCLAHCDTYHPRAWSLRI